jgi:hypothetical protein
MAGRKGERDESAIDDEHNDEMDDEGDSFKQARMRRASEGQSSVKSDGKKNDLRCDKCGKGYKHSSCLTKHLFVPTLPLPPLPSRRSRFLLRVPSRSLRFVTSQQLLLT